MPQIDNLGCGQWAVWDGSILIGVFPDAHLAKFAAKHPWYTEIMADKDKKLKWNRYLWDWVSYSDTEE